jgi:hypothetical protein
LYICCAATVIIYLDDNSGNNAAASETSVQVGALTSTSVSPEDPVPAPVDPEITSPPAVNQGTSDQQTLSLSDLFLGPLTPIGEFISSTKPVYGSLVSADDEGHNDLADAINRATLNNISSQPM